MSDAQLKSQGRGSFDYVCDGIVYVVKWHDSALVSLASNYHTHQPVQTANRRVASAVARITQPMLVSQYNRGMGGLDVLDRMLAQYRPTIRAKKWWWPLFAHGVNLSIVAAWRLYQRLHPGSDMSHLKFRRNIVICLLKVSEATEKHHGGHHVHLPMPV